MPCIKTMFFRYKRYWNLTIVLVLDLLENFLVNYYSTDSIAKHFLLLFCSESLEFLLWYLEIYSTGIAVCVNMTIYIEYIATWLTKKKCIFTVIKINISYHTSFSKQIEEWLIRFLSFSFHICPKFTFRLWFFSFCQYWFSIHLRFFRSINIVVVRNMWF